jgi:hypothetical protein
VPTTVPLLAGFLAACVIQVSGGVLLLWPRRSGIVVSLVGMLLSAIFWWGSISHSRGSMRPLVSLSWS